MNTNLKYIIRIRKNSLFIKQINLYCLYILLISMNNNVFSQSYNTHLIEIKSDSILRAHIGDLNFTKYALKTQSSYVYYKNKANGYISEPLNTRKNTKGKLNSVFISWKLSIPYNKCDGYDTITGITTLILDSLLNIKQTPDLGFIPDTYWKNIECDFIDKPSAILIAKKQDLSKGIDSLKAYIFFDNKSRRFNWIVSHTLNKFVTKQRPLFPDSHEYIINKIEIEEVIIDALTGEVVSKRTYILIDKLI